MEYISRQTLSAHMQRIVQAGYARQLRSRRYYAGGSSNPKVYQLSELGAQRLRDEGYKDARASQLGGEVRQNHTLAILDCRLALSDLIERGNYIATDRALTYNGNKTIRPDNLVVIKSRPKLIFESESNPLRKPYALNKKVKNLIAFFLSDEAQEVDPLVRIVYLWGGTEHEAALDLWMQACTDQQRQARLARLPFEITLIAHHEFMRQPTLEETPAFERLLQVRNPIYVQDKAPNSNGQPSPALARPAQIRFRSRQETLLDDDSCAFLVEFARLHAELDSGEAFEDLIFLITAYLTARPELAQAIMPPIRRVCKATNHAAAAYALEALGQRFFEHLGIPVNLDDFLDGKYALVGVQAATDGRNRPGLAIRIDEERTRLRLGNWPGRDAARAIRDAFQRLFSFFVNYPEALGLFSANDARTRR